MAGAAGAWFIQTVCDCWSFTSVGKLIGLCQYFTDQFLTELGSELGIGVSHDDGGALPDGQCVCHSQISPCTIKSRSSLLAPAHPGGPGKRAVNGLWWCELGLGVGSGETQWHVVQCVDGYMRMLLEFAKKTKLA